MFLADQATHAIILDRRDRRLRGRGPPRNFLTWARPWSRRSRADASSACRPGSLRCATLQSLLTSCIDGGFRHCRGPACASLQGAAGVAPPCAQFGGGYDDLPVTAHLNDDRWDGGVQIGYNWQSRCTVFGIEADWSWTNLRAKRQPIPELVEVCLRDQPRSPQSTVRLLQQACASVG
jgi:hypothetical protein